MKNGMKFLPLVLFMLLFGITLNAQTSNYKTTDRTPGYWTFGLNGGLAYQTSDVPFTTEGWGAGLTLAKNLYYRPGSTFAFDLRGRLLYAESYGLDHERSYGITRNPVLNGMENLDYTKANNQSGFIFQNNRTHFGEIGLEGVLHFNKLRERTNINLSLFGGVGVGGYWARTDQQNNNSNQLYSSEYLGIDTTASRSVIRRELNDILDGYHESDAQGSDFDNIAFMPGAGIELGYQLTPRFSLGLGHKVTFTRTDDFDGVRYDNQNNLSADNDWHHYTNLNLRWIIDPKKAKEKGPEVDIINPQSRTTTIYQSSAFVRASVKHVNNAMDIDLTVNGKSTPFDYNENILKSEFILLEGKNTVTVSAFNAAGSDSETVTIIYVDRFKKDEPVRDNPRVDIPVQNDPVIEDVPVVETPRTPYPVVKITRPYRSSETVEQDRYRVQATIENVYDKNDIYFTVDGRRQDNFSLRGTRFESDIYLNEGSNRIKIEARNQRGSRSDQATIRLEEMVKLVKPLVEITKPYRDPFTTKNNRERIEATVGPLDNNCNILFKVNGRSISGFDYRGDRFTGTAKLREGRNEIEVVASNNAGTSSDRTIIFYEIEQQQPQIEVPRVNITTPNKSSSRTDKQRIQVKAKTQNISSKSGIDFIVNGRKNYDFNFDNRTGRISGSVNLEKGNNRIEISVRNQDGRDQDRVDVEYYLVVAPPNVKISKPRNRTKVETAKIAFSGTVSNVDLKSKVELYLNRKRVYDFGYASGRVTANLTLAKGKNQIVLKASNEGGKDEASVTVNYTMPVIVIAKPEVDFTIPSKNISTKQRSYKVTVKVKNVTDKNKMDLKLNGKSTAFKFDRRRKTITANVRLSKGNNKLIVAASNDSGTDSDQVTINMESIDAGRINDKQGKAGTVKLAKPTINLLTMSQPSADPFNPNTAKTRIVGMLENVKSKSEITLTVNGKRIKRFDFNVATGRLEVIHTIGRGAHTTLLKLKTRAGTIQKTTSITF